MRLTFLRDYGLSRRIISIIRKLVIYFKKHANTSSTLKYTVKSRQIRKMFIQTFQNTTENRIGYISKSSLDMIEGWRIMKHFWGIRTSFYSEEGCMTRSALICFDQHVYHLVFPWSMFLDHNSNLDFDIICML